MPSFLSKVLRRKKDEKDSSKRTSNASLLDGKFEAVSPTVSPSATHFTEPAQHTKERDGRDKDGGFSLFRPRSRAVSPQRDQTVTKDTPHLTLKFPVPKEEKSRALGAVFEADPDDRSSLPDSAIAERRLNPLEALLLVKACSNAIIQRGGLEALGVMHPHWYSASPDVQRRLISLFILSLAPNSPITTLTPSPTSPAVLFSTELEYTRSPHDVAAVLRWAIRHLRIEGASFGPGGWQWYKTFLEAERASSYPPRAFSDSLVPLLPAAHLQLLVATLDIISSFAAHAETNGISGSKLSKAFGLWLLTAERAEAADDWATFYARWEMAGRVLEHLFLAHIRDESVNNKMPLRLLDLVKQYPYDQSKSNVQEDLLPRPRFSTRQHDALLLRVDTRLPDGDTPKPAQNLLTFVLDALKSHQEPTSPEYDGLWTEIKKAAAAGPDVSELSPQSEQERVLSRIFDDETVRLLLLAASDNVKGSATSLTLPPSAGSNKPSRRRSMSLGAAPNGNGKANGATNGSSESPSSPTTQDAAASPTDWLDFSTAGFGDSALGKDFATTLLDKDVEVTTPPPVSRKTTKKRNASPTRSRRSSADNPAPAGGRPKPDPAAQLVTKTTVVGLAQLDEAFIDFWSDALLDPISSNWPRFVLCHLKPSEQSMKDGKPIQWLIIEQTFSYPPPPALTSPTTKRPSSPRPSIRSTVSASRKSATFTRKRFSFFTAHSTVGGFEGKTSRKKHAQSPLIGEMGEILKEKDKKGPAVPSKLAEPQQQKPPVKGLGLTGMVAGVGLAASKETAPALEPVPLVEAELPAETGKDAGSTEPITTAQEPANERPTAHIVPQEAAVRADPQGKALPPAPEGVVLAGETPGPQTALDTSGVTDATTSEYAPESDAASQPEGPAGSPDTPTSSSESTTGAVEQTGTPAAGAEQDRRDEALGLKPLPVHPAAIIAPGGAREADHTATLDEDPIMKHAVQDQAASPSNGPHVDRNNANAPASNGEVDTLMAAGQMVPDVPHDNETAEAEGADAISR